MGSGRFGTSLTARMPVIFRPLFYSRKLNGTGSGKRALASDDTAPTSPPRLMRPPAAAVLTKVRRCMGTNPGELVNEIPPCHRSDYQDCRKKSPLLTQRRASDTIGIGPMRFPTPRFTYAPAPENRDPICKLRDERAKRGGNHCKKDDRRIASGAAGGLKFLFMKTYLLRCR